MLIAAICLALLQGLIIYGVAAGWIDQAAHRC